MANYCNTIQNPWLEIDLPNGDFDDDCDDHDCAGLNMKRTNYKHKKPNK